MTNCISMINSIHDIASLWSIPSMTLLSPPFYIPHEFWALSFRFNQMVKSFFSTTYFSLLFSFLNFNFVFSNFSFCPAPLFPPSTLFSFYLSLPLSRKCSSPALPCPDTSRLHMFTFIPQKIYIYIYLKKLDYCSHRIIHNTKLVWAEPELGSI
jgi:hypothetical protein